MAAVVSVPAQPAGAGRRPWPARWPRWKFLAAALGARSAMRDACMAMPVVKIRSRQPGRTGVMQQVTDRALNCSELLVLPVPGAAVAAGQVGVA